MKQEGDRRKTVFSFSVKTVVLKGNQDQLKNSFKKF